MNKDCHSIYEAYKHEDRYDFTCEDIDGKTLYVNRNSLSFNGSLTFYYNEVSELHRLGGPAKEYVVLGEDGKWSPDIEMNDRNSYYINGKGLTKEEWKTEVDKYYAKERSQKENPDDAHLYDL